MSRGLAIQRERMEELLQVENVDGELRRLYTIKRI